MPVMERNVIYCGMVLNGVLQGTGFNRDPGLLLGWTLVVCCRVSGLIALSNKHAGRGTGYAKYTKCEWSPEMDWYSLQGGFSCLAPSVNGINSK